MRREAGSAKRPESTRPFPTTTVRQAGPKDLSTVVALRLSLLREHADHPIYGRLRTDAANRARDLFAAQLDSPTEVIFLAEAFTRPKIMHRLAKLGFTQSYTYFAWRNTKHELIEALPDVSLR